MAEQELNATFINITHPSQRKEATTKRKVAQYIGLNFRNRSKPVARREAGGLALQLGRDKPASLRQLRAKGVPVQTWINRDLHGLRSDPFASYPIQSQVWLPEAVDFFLKAYGPTHLLRGIAETNPERTTDSNENESQITPVQQYFRYSLQHPMMFEALIALSLSNLRIQTWEKGQADRETTYHYANVLNSLQEVLKEREGFRETAVLWSILALVELEYLAGNMVAYEAHIKGLQHLVDIQGGMATFDQSKLLGPAIRGALAFWQFLKFALTDDRGALALDHLLSNDRTALPEPWVSESNATAKGVMNVGIVTLVQQRKLSIPVIKQARDVDDNWENVDLHSSPYDAANASNLELRERGWDLLALWQSPNHGGLTLADYLLLIGLQHILLDTTHAERMSPLYLSAVLKWAAVCSQALEIVDQQTDDATADLLIWTCVKLSGSLTATFLKAQSSSEDDARFQLFVKMMHKYPETRDWGYLEAVLKRFQWEERCMKFWWMVWKMVVSRGTVIKEVYVV